MNCVVNIARAAAFWSLLLCADLARAEDPLTVVTSIRPLTLLVAELAGDAVRVNTLLSANADPHNVALKISERRRLDQADLVIWLGPEFEKFLQKPLSIRSADQQLILAELSDLHWPPLESSSDSNSHPHTESFGRDMHLWLDPHNGKVILHEVYRRLVAQQPNLEPLLKPRLELAVASLARIQAELQMQLQPLVERGFGVDHNGYGHFVHAFGLRQLAAVSDVASQSMSAKQRYQLQKQLNGAACLLVERPTPVNQRLAEALKLPSITADPLANDPALSSYSDFITELGDAFYRCLTSGL